MSTLLPSNIIAKILLYNIHPVAEIFKKHWVHVLKLLKFSNPPLKMCFGVVRQYDIYMLASKCSRVDMITAHVFQIHGCKWASISVYATALKDFWLPYDTELLADYFVIPL